MAGVFYVTKGSLDERAAAWKAAVAPWTRGRTWPPLGHSALLVIDCQRYFSEPGSHAYLPALDVITPRILRLMDCFAAAGRPVVATRQGSGGGEPTMMSSWWNDELLRGEERAELIAPVAARPHRLLDKAQYSAFLDTGLEQILSEERCDTVVICGLMTHLCCESTARDAFMRGLSVVMVADACAAPDEDLHVGALRSLAHGFALIEKSAEVEAGLRAAASCEGARRSGSSKPAEPPGEGGAGASLRKDEPWARVEADPPELAVVGAGPAGLAAAIQAVRAGLKVVLLDPDPPGGLARNAALVENYPGFPGGISGDALAERFVSQASLTGVRWHRDVVEAIEQGPDGRLRLILPGFDRALEVPAVIVATGTAPRTLPCPAPPGAIAHSVREIEPVRGRRVLVVGGGEAALDQALLAHRRGASQVRIAVRSPAPRAMELLARRVRERGMEILTKTEIREIVSASEGFRARLLCNGSPLEIEVDAVLACIGRTARFPRLPETPALEEDGRPLLDRLGRTSIPGLYLAGDAFRGRCRQIGIAVGDGLAAAMHAEGYVRNLRKESR